MSLKAFKESLQTYSARRISRHVASATHVHVEPETKPETIPEAAPVVARKPPKTSLRDQFAGYGGLLTPQLPSTYSPAPGLKETEERSARESRPVQDGGSDSRGKRSFLQGCGLQRCSSGVAEPKEDVATVEDEDRHVQKRRKVESLNGDVKPAREEHEAVHDSEAGLFIQAEEGPYEPLVLWPPSGEGSSSGVEDGRVVQVPASINSRLLPHQRDGVKFLYNLYREGRGGILGDDM